MQVDFSGKVVLISGGNSGIGRSMANLFSQHGATVVVAARRADEGETTVRKIQESGGDAIFVRADISQASAVEALIDQIDSAYGRLDYALNNAGTFLPDANVVDLQEEDWDRIVNVNLKGTWLSMKYEIPLMLKNGGGSIVNMGSVTSFWVSDAVTAYNTSKHGLIGLTKSAAKQFAGEGVRVNAICPGVIKTPMSDDFVNDDNREEWIGRHPVGRLGTPEDIAEAALWLCSDAASFVTGHALVADGGFLL